MLFKLIKLNKNKTWGNEVGKYKWSLKLNKIVYECRHGHYHEKEILCGI